MPVLRFDIKLGRHADCILSRDTLHSKAITLRDNDVRLIVKDFLVFLNFVLSRLFFHLSHSQYIMEQLNDTIVKELVMIHCTRLKVNSESSNS